MVNTSMGAASTVTVSGTRMRSCAASYAVPHCPVCRFTMSCQPVGTGSVQRVYVPAGTTTPPMTRSRSVRNWVAALAPVRQTVPHGTTFPKISRPRFEGRP
jgi:hypothetical protein